MHRRDRRTGPGTTQNHLLGRKGRWDFLDQECSPSGESPRLPRSRRRPRASPSCAMSATWKAIAEIIAGPSSNHGPISKELGAARGGLPAKVTHSNSCVSGGVGRRGVNGEKDETEEIQVRVRAAPAAVLGQSHCEGEREMKKRLTTTVTATPDAKPGEPEMLVSTPDV